ncbi:DeoR/GlpR family DNA-binding transcription regulator [Granulosicoccus sp. 3-233]|uniref:DeoR/GlpR family DNA-binding transcription regulator n=1 Tax=Granulosicoccus sp. 3-233 TaxID=3417969 RepID=UPI003D347407
MANKKQIRHRRLLSLLETGPNMRVNELADELEVTAETIRRDLDELSGKGVVDRTYGGAMLKASHEPVVNIRHNLMTREREGIARAAVKQLYGAKIIMIGSGATTTHVARRIAIEMNGITVITHSFGVATVLSLNPTICVMMAPGIYHGTEGAMHGSQTLRYLDDFHVDWAITGASGLTARGASDALIDAGDVYSCMIKHASRTMVVADRTKFNKVFTARFAKWSDIDKLVTDERPGPKLSSAVKKADTEIVVSSSESASS